RRRQVDLDDLGECRRITEVAKNLLQEVHDGPRRRRARSWGTPPKPRESTRGGSRSNNPVPPRGRCAAACTDVETRARPSAQRGAHELTRKARGDGSVRGKAAAGGRPTCEGAACAGTPGRRGRPRP